MQKYLFTGFPYSGTAYTAALLTMNGIPCGHEVGPSIWRWKDDPEGEERRLEVLSSPQRERLIADANGLVALDGGFDHPFYEGWRVVHLVRHPVLVVSNWVALQKSSILEAVRTWVNCQRETAKRAFGRVRVEQPHEILAAVGFSETARLEMVPKDFNTHRGHAKYQRLQWHDMPGEDLTEGRQLRALCEEYGYSTESTKTKYDCVPTEML